MADILNKDPFTYQKERDSFLSNLRQFHTNRRTPFQRVPSVGGKDVDLFLLYWKVTALGGWEKVNEEQRWDDLHELFHIPKACVNSSQALKQTYIRYLDLYEKVHFFGEDPDQRDFGVDEATRSGRKPAKRLRYAVAGVPLAYNYQQHDVPSFMRETSGMSMEFVEASRYKKLEMTLLSGLPNEVDFAMNTCTLLSNKGRHTLQLKETPRLLELLLAHVGIYRDGPGSLQQLHQEGWRPNTKRNFRTFWQESVDDAEINELLVAESLFFDKERHQNNADERATKEGDKLELDGLLAVGRGLGVHDVEGQRIQQLAVLIRNLSFEEENAEILSSNMLVFRFLMLCIHNKYNSLKQLGLDTFANMALRMALDPIDYRTTQLVMRTMSRCIGSVDKFEIVSGMDILGHLCQVEQNEMLLAENLDMILYENIVRMLTLHDIQLIVFTLETLYQLSELGELASSCIAHARTAVDTLVQLVTVEAQSYGPNSLVGIKVVEHVPATPAPHIQQHVAMTPRKLPQHYATISTPQSSYAHKYPQAVSTPPPSGSSQLANQQGPLVDSETLACHWVQAYYEYGGSPENALSPPVVSKSHLYLEYLSTCKRTSVHYVVNDKTFAGCIRAAFPKADIGTLDKCDVGDLLYRGICRRQLPLPFPPPSQQDVCKIPPQPGGAQYTAHMAGHPGSPSNTSHQLAHTAGTGSPLRPSTPQDMACTPDAKSTDSSLIKSLLANKVHMHQRQLAGDGSDCASPKSNQQQLYQQQWQQQWQQQQQILPKGHWSQTPPSHTLHRPCIVEKRPFNDQPRSADGKFISRKILSSASAQSMQCRSPMSEHCKQPLARRMLPTEGMEVCLKSERAQDLLHSEKSVVVSSIQCVENSQQLVDVAAPADDERYSVSRAKMERLNDHALGATEAMIEKIENRYVTLLEQELEKQAQADQSLATPRQVTNTLPEAASTLPSQTSLPSDASQPSNTAMHQTHRQQDMCLKLNKSATQNATDCVSGTSAIQNVIGSASVVQNVPNSASSESVVQNITDSESVVQNVTDSESVVQNVTDSESVVQNGTDSESVVQNVTDSESVVQNVTDSASLESVVQNVTDSESVLQNVTDSASRESVVQCVTDSAFSRCDSQKVKERTLSKSALQGIRNNAISNSTLEVITNNASLATENADLASDCDQNCNPESRHSQTKLHLNGSEKVIAMPDGVRTTSHCVASMEHGSDEHGVRERTCCEHVTSNSCQVGKTGLTNGMAIDSVLLVEDSDERHLKDKLECDRSVESTALKLKACTDDVLLASKLKEEQRLGKVANMLQDNMKERLGGLNGVVNHMSNGTDHRDSDTFAADIQEELLEKAAILSMEAKATKNVDSDLWTSYENGCLAASATPQQNSTDGNHHQPGITNSCPTFSNCISQLPARACVTGDNYVSNKGDIAGSYPCDSQIKQTLLASTPVVEQGQGDGICLVVTGKAPSLAANVLPQQLLQQISLGDNSENSSTSSQGELSAALLQQPANSGMSALERAALAADIPGAAEVAAQARVMPSQPAMQGLALQGGAAPAVVQASQMMAIPQMVMAVAPQHHPANNIQPVSIQGIMSQAQLVGQMMQQSGQPLVMQGQQLVNQGQQIQIVPVSGQASTAAVGQPHMLLPSIQLVAGAQPLFFSPQQQQQMLTPQLVASQPMVCQPQVQLLPSASHQQQQVLVSIQPQQQLRFVSPGQLAQQTDSPAQFHVQIVPGAATSVATVPVSQQINVVNILPQPVAAKPQVITAQHQAGSAPPRIQPMPSSSAPCVVTATPSSASQLSPTSAARRTAKSPLGSRPSKRKKAARSRSNSSEIRSTTDAAQSGQQMTAAESAQQYMCEWAGCQRCFERRQALVKHAMQVHFDHSCSTIVCQWQGCDILGRQKWSFVQHLQERHLSEVAQRAGIVRRLQMGTVDSGAATPAISTASKPPPATTPASTAPVYPEDAALQAVRRFATRPPYQEFMEVKEGPVTKHIRLTSALILRNLARYSSHGRSLIKRHEQHLAYVALSSVEASTAISNCLWEIQKH